MKAKGWTGLIVLALCTTVALAQEEYAATRPSPEAEIASSDFNVGSYSTSRPDLRHRGVPTHLHVGFNSSNWLSSPGMLEAMSLSGGSSISACSPTYADLKIETPGGGVESQPLISKAMFHEALTREHMIKMAHDFVPGQPLPDAPSYTPMTSREKFNAWAKHTYSADMFVGTMFDAAILQASGAYPSYHGGMLGYGQRYGTALVSAEASSLFARWLFPTLFHQDPRYFPSKQTNAFDRMAYAASRAFITRSDDGRNVINTSLIMSLLFSSALANGYKPNYEESFQATLANTAAGLGSAAQMHLLDEFWPDLKRILLKAEPHALKQMQQDTTDKWQDFSSTHLSKKHAD